MKKFKKLSFTILISCFLMSCGGLVDEIIDKACDIEIDAIIEDYNERIELVENDTNLTQDEKDEKIAALSTERDDEIKLFEEDCAL